MKKGKEFTFATFVMCAFFGMSLFSSAQGAGTVWVSDTFGQSGDRIGQFADRGNGQWVQVLKDRTRVHSYRQVAVNDQYVELSGDGGVVRLHANRALTQRGRDWNPLANGRFQNGNPLQAAVSAPPASPAPIAPPATGATPMDTRGAVWISSSFGQAGDRIGQFASRGGGQWVQVMKDGTHVHTYREAAVTDQYVELNGDGGEIRLYADHAMMKRGNSWNPWTYGRFQVGNPAQTGSGVVPPANSQPGSPNHGGPRYGENGGEFRGMAWVSDTFGQTDDRVGQFARRDKGQWDQVLKNGTRVHSYRETSVNDRYVEMSGTGGVVRLYADKALVDKGLNQKTWTYGGFRNGSPLRGG